MPNPTKGPARFRTQSNTTAVTIADAAIVMNMNLRTLRRRITRGEIQTVSDPRDRRCKLVLRSEIERYLGEFR